jgi:hypothetical protein
VSPNVLRRLLDVLVGGALLAQATLATTPPIDAGRGLQAVQHQTAAASPVWSGPIGAAHRRGPVPAEPLAPGFDPPDPAIGPPVAASPTGEAPAEVAGAEGLGDPQGDCGGADAVRLQVRRGARGQLTRQLDLDPIRVVDRAKVALFRASVPYLPRYLDTLHHEPNNGPTPLQGPAPPLLHRPLLR